MSLWTSKKINVKSIDEIEVCKTMGELKIIRHQDSSVDITIAIDLNAMKSYVLEYLERIG